MLDLNVAPMGEDPQEMIVNPLQGEEQPEVQHIWPQEGHHPQQLLEEQVAEDFLNHQDNQLGDLMEVDMAVQEQQQAHQGENNGGFVFHNNI